MHLRKMIQAILTMLTFLKKFIRTKELF